MGPGDPSLAGFFERSGHLAVAPSHQHVDGFGVVERSRYRQGGGGGRCGLVVLISENTRSGNVAAGSARHLGCTPPPFLHGRGEDVRRLNLAHRKEAIGGSPRLKTGHSAQKTGDSARSVPRVGKMRLDLLRYTGEVQARGQWSL